MERSPRYMFIRKSKVKFNQRQVSGEWQVLLHKLLKVGDIDTSIKQCLFAANVLKHVWDLAFPRCFQVFGGLGEPQRMMTFLLHPWRGNIASLFYSDAKYRT